MGTCYNTCALPIELSLNEHIKIVMEFAETTFIPQGICVYIAIHSGKRQNGINNPHVHILLIDRPVDRNGFCPKKNREWNDRKNISILRECWERTLNRAFERNGLDVRVSRESLEVQGIKREATKHLGRAVTEMEHRGVFTERGEEHRKIIERNRLKELEKQMELDRKKSRELER